MRTFTLRLRGGGCLIFFCKFFNETGENIRTLFFFFHLNFEIPKSVFFMFYTGVPVLLVGGGGSGVVLMNDDFIYM